MIANNNHELSKRLQENGVFLFRHFLTDEQSSPTNNIPSITLVLSQVRQVVKQAPLFTPRMYDARPFRYRMTNCGNTGWLASPQEYECTTPVRKGYYYDPINPYTGRPWPQMPLPIRTASRLAATHAGCPEFKPEVCLINFYRNHRERLGIHQDNSENNLQAPVVSFSIGDNAIFQIGGLKKDDPTEDILLSNRDCLVLTGASRLFYHKLAYTIPRTSNILSSGGRLNLTIRQID
jgi:alkylated DNA repair protein (DNA oxidative demethylase)